MLDLPTIELLDDRTNVEKRRDDFEESLSRLYITGDYDADTKHFKNVLDDIEYLHRKFEGSAAEKKELLKHFTKARDALYTKFDEAHGTGR